MLGEVIFRRDRTDNVTRTRMRYAGAAAALCLVPLMLGAGCGKTPRVDLPYSATQARISMPYGELVTRIGQWADIHNMSQPAASQRDKKKRRRVNPNDLPFRGWGQVRFEEYSVPTFAILHLSREWTYSAQDRYERNIDVAKVTVTPGAPHSELDVSVITHNALERGSSGKRDRAKEQKIIQRMTYLLGDKQVQISPRKKKP